MRVSFPIVIFSNVTQLQQIAKNKAFSITSCKKMAKIADPVEQFKVSLCNLVQSLHLACKIQKPFNPMLGKGLCAEF